MPGKVNIGGTAYTVAYGKTKIGGTTYDIGMGKTKIDGTVKEINFGTIPYKYQQVEYIKNNSSSNKPYVNLPITSQEGLKLEIYAAYETYNNTQCYIGTYSESSSWQQQKFYLQDDGESFFYGYVTCAGTNVTARWPASTSLEFYRVFFGNYGTSNNMSLYLYEPSNSRESTETVTRARALTATNLPMRIMRADASVKGLYGRITAYNANNAIIMDLYPCYRKSDNTPGFYDKVTHSLLTNSGSGTLTVGPDVSA